MEPSTAGASLLSGIATLLGAFFSPGSPALLDTYSVNRQWNALGHIADSANHGVSDYWATPKETIRSGGGDSEDLAIGKLFELVSKGVSEHTLRLVLLESKDASKSKFVVSRVTDEGEYYLDADTNAIKPASKFSGYEVVYKLNRHSFEVGSFDRLARHKTGLTNWHSMLARMKQDGSLEGELFPGLAPIYPTKVKANESAEPLLKNNK